MLKYVLRRLGYMAVTLFLVLTINFVLLQLMPGSPFDNLQKLTPEQREVLDQKYGLKDPVFIQYTRYMSGVVKGDFGDSFKLQNQPVMKLISDRLPITVQVGLIALVFGVVVGIVLGALAAIYRNSFWDHFVTVAAVIGVSIPSFVLAAFLQYFFSKKLGWFPYLFTRANPSRGITIFQEYWSLVLPAFTLSLGVIATTMRYMRSELVEVFSSDFILLARAKGLTRNQVIFRHAIRNALIPVVTIVGPITVGLITGSLVVEMYFGIPGLSRLISTAVVNKDLFLVIGIAFFYSLIYVVVILFTDILYGVIDPRIRLAGGDGK